MNFDEKQTDKASESFSVSNEKELQKEMTDEEKIDLAAEHILTLYRPAFLELAK